MRTKLIIGNWKMNKTEEEATKFVNSLINFKIPLYPNGIACSSIHLSKVKEIGRSKLLTLAQNCHFEKSGAFTGEISPFQLKQDGYDGAIIGHSERRTLFHEDDALINKKTIALLNNDLHAIFCLGESLKEFEQNQTNIVLSKQLSEGLKNITKEQTAKLIIAYEPIWAIGTGKTATSQQAQVAISFIRSQLAKIFDLVVSQKILILYGGSVKPDNISELLKMPDIDGALVGGASLDVDSFIKLCQKS